MVHLHFGRKPSCLYEFVLSQHFVSRLAAIVSYGTPKMPILQAHQAELEHFPRSSLSCMMASVSELVDKISAFSSLQTVVHNGVRVGASQQIS